MTLARPSPPWSLGGRGEWASAVRFVRPTIDQGLRLGCGAILRIFSQPMLVPDHLSYFYCIAQWQYFSLKASALPSVLQSMPLIVWLANVSAVFRRFFPTPSELQAILSQTPASQATLSISVKHPLHQ